MFPRNDFTLSRNAETWIFLVWIIMYDKIGGVPNTVWGGGGRFGVYKPLKMLGFLCQFDTISYGFRLPILRVANLLTAFHKLRSIKNG